MKLLGKDYKREIVRAHMTHSDRVRFEVRQMRAAANKKDYWNYCKNKTGRNTQDIDFDKFTDFFKKLNERKTEDSNMTDFNNIQIQDNAEFDLNITEGEIEEQIKKLPNNKAMGQDFILNEYIKSSVNVMMPIYVKIFNAVYSSSVIPESWRIGLIKPIFKNKGSKNEPDNYRPISILSCMGKLFTSLLNARLTKYLDNNKIIGEEQIGFRKNYSTTDGIFVVHFLTKLLKARGKKLMCAFIDIKKCFPSIWRDGLWQKLSLLNLGNKMFNVIRSLYESIKSCLVIDSQDEQGNNISRMSEVFACENGLREGENLSPLLFSLYVNDLNQFFINKACTGVSIDCIEDEDLVYYCKLLLLMYADDTVLFASSVKDLRVSLNTYLEYCRKWKLEINVEKTKIICFGLGRKPVFKLNNQPVEVVNDFNYLGIPLSKNGKFINAMKNNINKATKAMHTLRRTFYDKKIPIDCQIDIYEKTIEPILLYGSEIWGAENTSIIEKYHLKILKQILGVKHSTPAYMVLGETGKLPLRYTIDTRIFNYWYRIVTGKQEKLSYQIYKIMNFDRISSGVTYKWLQCIEKILNDTGYTYLWNEQSLTMAQSRMVLKTLKDQQIQNLFGYRDTSSKARNYLFLKENWEMESYLKNLDFMTTKRILYFRTCNHKLPIEKGRHAKPKIPEHRRYCPFCTASIGDSFHYILECKHFHRQRKKYVDKRYTTRPNMYQFQKLMQCKDTGELRNLSIFMNIIMKEFK